MIRSQAGLGLAAVLALLVLPPACGDSASSGSGNPSAPGSGGSRAGSGGSGAGSSGRSGGAGDSQPAGAGGEAGVNEPGDSCDPLVRDCGDPDVVKCAYVALIEDETYSWQCFDVIGNQGQDERCVTARGIDDCVAGLYCVTPDGNDGSGTCRPICGDADDCARPEWCHPLSPAGAGWCALDCALFGDECGTGDWCAPTPASDDPTHGECVVNGTAQIGESCSLDPTCDGSVCHGGECMDICDADHPCDERVCERQGGNGYLTVCIPCTFKSYACFECRSACQADLDACIDDSSCARGLDPFDVCTCTAQMEGADVSSCIDTFRDSGGTIAGTLLDCASTLCADACGL